MDKKSATEILGKLSRRERQIMDIVYARGEATSQDVHQDMADAPSYSAVRAQMSGLVEKGFLKHQRIGLKYLFSPTLSVKEAGESALARVVRSFFDNSPVSVVATLLDSRELAISDQELQQLRKLISQKTSKR